MAAPTNLIEAKIRGLKEAKAAFQALPSIVRDRLNDATFVTASEIERQAKANILASPSVQTRALHDAIGFSVNENAGKARIGIMNVTTTLRIGNRRVRVRGIIRA